MRLHPLILLLLLAGCGVAVEDRTAAVLPRNAPGLYDLTVRVEKASSGVNITGVQAVTGYGTFAMVPVGGDDWRAQIPLANCVNGFDVRYDASWQLFLAGNTKREPLAGVRQKWLSGPPPQSCTTEFGRLFTVTSTADLPDAAPGDGVCAATGPGAPCTLRAAVMEANASRGQDRIELGSATYPLTRGGSDDNAAIGDLDILDELTLAGSGAVIDAAGSDDRVIDLSPTGEAVDLELRGVTIRGGMASRGGGIHNRGRLHLFATTVRDNNAETGGGIYNEGGFVEVQDSDIRDNRTSFTIGGGIYSQGAGALVTVRASSVIGNHASQHGGGLGVIEGRLEMRDSTVAQNEAATYGGGLFINPAATATLRNLTITGNIADSDRSGFGNGGGIKHASGSGSLYLANSIVAGNLGPSPRDCAGTIDSQGYNLLGSATGCAGTVASDLTGTDVSPIDAKLLFLSTVGNSRSHSLQNASPAIDAGNPEAENDARMARCTHVDQRGNERPRPGPGVEGRGHCDIGAVER